MYNIDNIQQSIDESIEHAIINRHKNGYNEICTKKYDVFGLFLCFDDLQFLYQNIQSEIEFYYKTKSLDLPYFKLKKGELYKSIFNEEEQKYFETEKLPNSEIYVNKK